MLNTISNKTTNNYREIMMEAFGKAMAASIQKEYAATENERYAWQQAEMMLFDIGNQLREEIYNNNY